MCAAFYCYFWSKYALKIVHSKNSVVKIAYDKIVYYDKIKATVGGGSTPKFR